MLEAQDVSFRYSRQPVLEHASLRVDAGEMVALLGPNGAGKTTLLKILAGLLKAKSGHVIAPEPRAQRIAYLSQTEVLPEEFSVLQIVRLGRMPFQGFWARETPQDRDAVERAMRRTNMFEFADRWVGSLSGGERQRVALARALAQEPKILLLDEPTNHLDLAHQHDLMKLLRLETRAGLGVVMVVHDLNLAALADRCALLQSGRIIADAAPLEVLREDMLERVYGVKLETLQASDGRVVVVTRA
jgi:ABC-type cobalamin/Fe3+-siderophores transport system ATPase subunit